MQATCTNSHSSAHSTSIGASVPCQVLHFSTTGTQNDVQVQHDDTFPRARAMQVETADGDADAAAALGFPADFDLGVDGAGAAAAAAGGVTLSGATGPDLASFFMWN